METEHFTLKLPYIGNVERLVYTNRRIEGCDCYQSSRLRLSEFLAISAVRQSSCYMLHRPVNELDDDL
jgi:hypothetical protein